MYAAPAEGGLPPELARARQIKRAGMVVSGLMLVGGGIAAGLSGLLQPLPAATSLSLAAVAGLAPASLAAAKAVLGELAVPASTASHAAVSQRKPLDRSTHTSAADTLQATAFMWSGTMARST